VKKVRSAKSGGRQGKRRICERFPRYNLNFSPKKGYKKRNRDIGHKVRPGGKGKVRQFVNGSTFSLLL